MTRHRLDLFSLLSGLALSAIGVVALTGIDLEVARWLGPAVLIGVGVLVLATVASRGRGPSDGSDAGDAVPDAADAVEDAAPGDADGDTADDAAERAAER